MSHATPTLFLGTDSGATTSKTAGIFADGKLVSEKLRQSATNAQLGTDAVVRGWIEGVEGFLHEHGFTWQNVGGVGLALPGPYLSYGIMGRAANLPATFHGWNFAVDYSSALARAAGRAIPLFVGNDGNLGGVGEAYRLTAGRPASVLMLAPGSGLGAAYVDPRGLPLDGDTLSGMEGGHMPAPLHLLDGIAPFRCGCGREWGCIEAYTTISGLPQLLDVFLQRHPTHPLASSPLSPKEKSLSLRTLAQQGDALALDIFDFQARALGLHIANLLMALDTEFVVIGGGLIDPDATTPEFRSRYLNGIRRACEPYLWEPQRGRVKIFPATLGELSQAYGAALVARHKFGSPR